ncbi:MAG: hypothetical protein Q9205_007602, partial [Flavoplaca limonia]
AEIHLPPMSVPLKRASAEMIIRRSLGYDDGGLRRGLLGSTLRPLASPLAPNVPSFPPVNAENSEHASYLG